MEVDQAGGAFHSLVHRARRQADGVERVEQGGLGGGDAPAVDLAEPVSEEAERPLDRIACVELAHHAGGGIARIDEGLLALGAAFDELALPLVQGLEVVAAHEDLAAHLEHRRLHALAAACGTAAIVRTVWVTSSPVSPSPRVAACTRSPPS